MRIKKRVLATLLLLLSYFWMMCSCAWAILPQEVLVVANKRVHGSVALAKYYMKKRGIPRENLLVLLTQAEESITCKEYTRWIERPVVQKIERLNRNKKQKGAFAISTIVTVYGVPLKIEESYHPESAQKTTRAAVDSELALVQVKGYERAGWIANPYFLPQASTKGRLAKGSVLLVGRLDAPSQEIVRRMIDDSLAVEQRGLEGIGYFDARGMTGLGEKEARLRGYDRYDFSLLRSAEEVKKRLPVVLENTPALFTEKSCPQAALYCGWYSYGKYISSFQWKRGAIGYHIASAECESLHQPGVTYWCPQILAGGAAATIGPVYEPYVEGFPLPEIFFGMLIQGMSLGEAYLLSLPFVSWQTILLGDPLYQPFPER